MENILKSDTLTLFLYFVVPGFVAVKAFDLLIPSERRDFGAELIQLVSYSLFNWVLFARLLTISKAMNPAELEFGSLAARIGYVFVCPVILALIAYYLRSSQILRRLLTRLRIHLVDPMPTAWDHFFKSGQSCYIIFHLKSKDIIGAAFHGRSFATAYPDLQEIYVEELWVVDAVTRRFVQRVTNTKGAIIKMDDCDYIEMYATEPSLAPLTPHTTP